MATQLATAERKAAKVVAKAPVRTGGHLAAFIPQTLEEAWRLSAAIAQSGMAPKSYGSDANKIMVGIMAGAEVGMTPFVALQSFANINGNPALWGDGMLGLVEASGLMEDFEETDDGKEATCRAVRKGRPSPIINTYSMDDAKTAGLLGKQGPWQTSPKRMRKLRARAFTLRDGFSDVLKGIKSAEEVRDYAPMDGGTLGGVRPALTAEMLADHSDERRDEAEPQTGRADEDHGDQHDDETSATRARRTADDLIKRCAGAKLPSDLTQIETVLDGHRAAMPDALVTEVEVAISDARDALS